MAKKRTARKRPKAHTKTRKDASKKMDETSKRIADRRALVMQLRLEALTYQQISDRLIADHNIKACTATICKDLEAEFERLGQELHEKAVQLRDWELQRIDTLWQAYFPAARTGDQDACELCMKLLDRRVKLLGLNAPERQDVNLSNRTAADALRAFEQGKYDPSPDSGGSES